MLKTIKNILSGLRFVGAGIFVLLSVGVSSAQTVQTLYATPGSPTWRDNYTGGSGCIFTVGPTNVVVSHLGYFCSNAVSLAQVQSTAGLQANHYVGIYSANPVQLLVQVIVPAGTGADCYTNQFAWMPLNPPFLLQSNMTYYVAAQALNADGDLWGDNFAATFNPFFLGQTTNNVITAPETAYGPGNLVWPVGGFSNFGTNNANTTYCIEGMANLPVDSARVGVQGTNISVASGPLSVVGFASGQSPINYQWWQPGSPPTQVAGQNGPNLTFANATSANSGIYFLTASNSLGGEASPNVFVTVSDIPVSILAGPTNTAVFNNYPASFSVVVTGAPPISIQWYSNNVAIANATNFDVNGFIFTNTFTFTAQTANNGYVYSAVASNYVGSTAYTVTNSATLTVLPNFGYPQHILHGPIPTNYFYEANQNGSSGDTGNNPSGICGGKFVMANSLLITHLGYCATGLVLNGYTALTDSHRIDLYDNSGNLLGYATVTNGTPVSGAINGYLWAQLNPPLLLTNGGTYTLGGENFYEVDPWGTTYVPTNWDTYITPGGSVDSAVYINSAWPAQPTSGGYGSQIYSLPNMGDLVISNQIFSLIAPGSLTQAAGTTATLNGFVNGPPPVLVQWYQNGVLMSGQTNITLTLNSLSAGVSTYTLVAMNGSLAATSSVATVTAYASPVIINALPLTYTNIANTNLMALYLGANPNFSITALGAGTLNYRWYTNGVLVGTATTNSYKFSGITATSPTNFFCVISNAYLSTPYTTTSTVWSASVLPNPTNSTGGLAPYPQSVLALNPIGYWRLNDTNLDGPDDQNGDNGYVCHDYVSGNDGIYTNLSLGNPGYSPIADPSDTSAQFGEVDENNDFGDSDANSIAGINFGSPTNTSKAFTIEAWVSGYVQTYDAGIVTLGWGGGGEQFDLDCGSDTAPTSHGFRFLMRDSGGTVHSVSSTNEPSTIPLSQGPWTHLVGVVDEISNQAVTFYINGQSVGSAALVSGSGVLAGTNAALGYTSLMSIGSRMAAETGTYSDQYEGNINDVAIYNFALSSNQVLNQYLEGGQVTPYVSPAPPATLTVVAGSSFSLPATAFGSPVLGYQWINQTTSTLLASGSGTATGTSLNVAYTTNSTPANWNGQTLELTVTNAYGTTNYFVTLTVTFAPSITTNLPSSVTVGQGQPYTYNIGAVGVAPLAYQWYQGSSAIANATNAIYVPSTSSGGTNTFSVIVTNNYGSATSLISTFIVIPLPNTPLATYIQGLNPIGYWPMHEVEPAAQGDIETNYGTLGAQANGYYEDWMQPFSGFTHDYPSTIGGDPNSVFFSVTASGGGGITNGLLVNAANSGTVLNPPFTVECWCFLTQNVSYGDMWSQNGFEGLNAGTYGGGGGSVCGIRLDWGGNGANEFTVYGYDNSSGLNSIVITPTTVPTNTWLHTVVTCDANTNFSVFTNGVQCGSTAAGVGKYSPDYWTPFCVGTGRGYTRSLPQTAVADVAIYTNVVLPTATILNHYQVGINPAPVTSYFNTVMSSNPPVFLRMDSPAWANNTTQPPYSSLPVLYNYGSIIGNGVYSPGTVPGVARGPSATYTGLINQSTNVTPMSGVSTFADAGYNAVWDPSAPNGTGSNAFSVVCTFRGNPANNTFEDLVGHSDSSWRMTLGANAAGGGAQGSVQFTYGATASSTNNCNDGKWHQAVGVYQPAAPNTATPGTVLLYVDGRLNQVNTGVSSNGIVAGAPLYDVLLGAAPDYTNNPVGPGRQFDGQLCDVAIFTNALTPAQVQAMYLVSGGQQQALSMPYSGQLPVTWNYLGNNLGNNLGGTNFMTLYSGASPSFAVTVTGSPIYYQWYTNGVGVGSGTNAILTLPNVQAAFATYCIATNGNNSATSVVWSASIVTDPDSGGSFSQTIMSDNPMAYWRLNDSAGSTIATDYAGGANGVYGNQTTNGLPGVPIVASGNERSVAMDPSPTTMAQGTVTNSGIILNTNCITYVVWVMPTATEPAYTGLFVNRSTAGDSGVAFSGTPAWGYDWAGTYYAYNSGLGLPPTSQWSMGVVEVYPQSTTLAVYNTSGVNYATNNPSFDQVESFYGGNEIGSDPNGGTGRIFYGRMNEMAVFNYDLSQAQLSALYFAATNGALTTAAIDSQPQNATVTAAGTTNFTVGASSFLQPVTYQWYYNTAATYAGAAALANGLQANGSYATNVTTAQLTITNATSAAAGYYFAAVGNPAGTVNSAIASLTVNQSVATNPTNIVFTVVGGTNLMLSWPLNHTGWLLQAQTNKVSVGISTNWGNVNGSTSTNAVVVPLNLTNGCVFYRLVYP